MCPAGTDADGTSEVSNIQQEPGQWLCPYIRVASLPDGSAVLKERLCVCGWYLYPVDQRMASMLSPSGERVGPQAVMCGRCQLDGASTRLA